MNVHLSGLLGWGFFWLCVLSPLAYCTAEVEVAKVNAARPVVINGGQGK